jgi:hypothetical protein
MKRAHKAGQIDVLRWQTPRIRARTHLSASQRKTVLRGPTRGRQNLDWFPSRSALAGRSPTPSYICFQMFPYLPPLGTALGEYKRRRSIDVILKLVELG